MPESLFTWSSLAPVIPEISLTVAICLILLAAVYAVVEHAHAQEQDRKSVV